jgi:hypothetical protein
MLMRLCLLLCVMPLMAGELDKLAFLKGCWSGSDTFEMWMKPDAGSIMGAGRTVRNGKLHNSEFFSVTETADGVTLHVLLKLGGSVTQFKAKELTDSSVVFENPAHDYPQRVIYRKNADGSLLGRIEGVSEGKERAFDYPMKRAKCD